jgi:D-inositol-3-phosphate glycosyltransferase
MRIAMVSEHASPLAALGGEDAGGQNLHVANLSAALADLGHQVIVYTRREDATVAERVDTAHGYQVVHVSAGPAEVVPKDTLLPYMPRFADVLRHHWNTNRPDVVHAHFWMSGLASIRAARSLRIPVVQTFHALGSVKRRYQGAEDTSPAQRISEERAIGMRAAAVVATCSDEVTELAALGVPTAKVSVVPCGVDVAHFTPHGPVAGRTAAHRIVSVGRLVPRKGFDDVIAALPGLGDTELVVAGGPATGSTDGHTEMGRLRRLAVAYSVSSRVLLPGRVSRDDMPALLRSADVVVCAPWYEPFGIVPLEAMACGRPVVATAVGGLTDTVVDRVTGRLVPPEQPRVLASVLGALLSDEPLRVEYGAAGRGRVVGGYSWRQVALDTHAVYAHVDEHAGIGERASVEPSVLAGRANRVEPPVSTL